jgi:hypothetical protein
MNAFATCYHAATIDSFDSSIEKPGTRRCLVLSVRDVTVFVDGNGARRRLFGNFHHQNGK